MPFRYQIIFVLSLLPLGCGNDDSGPEKYEIEGFVTLDEQPVPQAALKFIPDAASGNAGPAAFANVKDGTFKIDAERGLVAGQSEVEISIPVDGSATKVRTVTRTVTISANGTNLLAMDIQSDDLKDSKGGEGGEGEDGSEEED